VGRKLVAADQEHEKAWTEEDITARGQAIAKDIAAIWRR
jgi:hypothetical protein